MFFVFSHRQQDFAIIALVIFLIPGKKLFLVPNYLKDLLWSTLKEILASLLCSNGRRLVKWGLRQLKVPGADRPLIAESARREKTSKNTLWRELRGEKFTQYCRQICVAIFDLE